MRALGVAVVTAITLIPLSAHAEDAPQVSPPETIAVHRAQLTPLVGWALWPHSVSGGLAGAQVGFRPHPMASFALNVVAYEPFNMERSGGSTERLSEAQGSAGLEAALYPFARSLGWGSARVGEEAGTFETYLLGGIGLVRTHPVSVVDPMYRTFDDWNNLIDLDVGIGGRVFVNGWCAVDLEVRDLMYFEKMESPTIGNPLGATASSRRDPAFWYDPDTHFTQVIQFRLGATFFLGVERSHAAAVARNR
jgi:hypothetical protein